MDRAAGGRLLSYALAASVATVLLVPSSLISDLFQEAHADGFFNELFSASLEGREATLSVSINPPILTTQTQQDTFVQFRLFDSNTNETFKFTTFIIGIDKGVGGNAQRLLPPDVFHTESGLLTFRIQPQEGPVTIFATQEQFINAWVADPGGTIKIRGPILLEGGLYHFRVEILGVDSIRELFSDDQVPKFDSWLSVGDVFNQQVQYAGASYSTTIISYYDQVEDFSFDESKKTFTWAMPFDWNVDRIRQTNFFVHEEVKIPKSMIGIGDSMSFSANVNDSPISGSKIQLDPYSSESDLVLHYLLNKDDIISLAEKVPDGASQMIFTLTPSADAPVRTTTEMATDTGGIDVAVQWTPNPLDAAAESNVKLDFSDAFSGEKLGDADVIYGMRIIDMEGNEVYKSPDLTAAAGTDTQSIDFPSNGDYRIEVEVKGLVQDGQPVDKTRNGIARGIVVVPEFPGGVIIAAAGILGTIILLQRFRKASHISGIGPK
ncbi:MAG: hypothetical protein ACREAZ_11250 [Nitrososphaera sp.]